MKKPITRFFSILALSATMVSIAQETKIQPCVTYDAMEEVFTSDPAARVRYEKAQAELMSQLQQQSAAKSAAPEFTIPVVFHVLHQGGAENLSDAELIQALAWVNQDFDRSHADVNTIVEPFQTMFIDSDIRLMLAHKAPDGKGTTGIIHHYDSRTVWNRKNQLGFNSPLYAGITWDPTKYLNIIIVKEIVAEAGQTGIVVGYTFKPGTHGSGDTRDGVVMTAKFLKTIQDTRSLTHEVGHWLNLAHTFGNTNNPGSVCGDDGICDTPPTKGKLGGCDASLSGNSCAATSVCGYSAGMQNTENIMNYADCKKNFTGGQTQVMRNALNSSVSGRSNLSSPTNLSFTDVNGSGPYAPMADFGTSANSFTICAGNTLEFKDYSFNGTITNYQWNASGAIVTSASSSITTILFPTSGTVNVALTVSGPQGTSVKNRLVTVVDGFATEVGPMQQSFEMETLPSGWEIVNPNAGTGTWKHTWLAADDGIGAYFIEGAGMPAGQEDIIYTPVIDMENSPSKEFSFAYAYARKTSATTDQFRVEGTADCGGTWVKLLDFSANQLSNKSGGIQSSPFIPTTDQWYTHDLATDPQSGGSWQNLKYSPHLTIRFVFTEGETGNGNNFFLDNINIPEGTVGIQELKSDIGLKLYPNPSADAVNIRFRLSATSSVIATVTDLAGRQLIALTDGRYDAGEHTLSFNENSKLAKGIYLVNFEVNGIQMTEKLIIR